MDIYLQFSSSFLNINDSNFYGKMIRQISQKPEETAEEITWKRMMMELSTGYLQITHTHQEITERISSSNTQVVKVVKTMDIAGLLFSTAGNLTESEVAVHLRQTFHGVDPRRLWKKRIALIEAPAACSHTAANKKYIFLKFNVINYLNYGYKTTF